MCSEIHRFSSFLRSMSSDDGGNLGCSSCPEIEPQIEPGIEPEIAEAAAEGKEKLNLGDDRREEGPEEITDKGAVPSLTRESEKRIHVEEDDDGFRTPTSSDHRIPPITQCPPAPRKPRPPQSKSKRKADSSSPGVRRSLQLDTSPEVESIFRPIDDDPEEPKFKKARRDDDDDESS